MRKRPSIGAIFERDEIGADIDFDDVTNATSYNELWEQTLNELEPDVKMLALHI